MRADQTMPGREEKNHGILRRLHSASFFSHLLCQHSTGSERLLEHGHYDLTEQLVRLIYRVILVGVYLLAKTCLVALILNKE